MNIEQANSSSVAELWSDSEVQVMSARSLEEAAQAMAAAIYHRFKESVVLARAFVTVPNAELPKRNQEFVRTLVDSAKITAELEPQTPVLSLIGTYGQEEPWCYRRQSKDHVGIPLLSSAFVGAIPMISRLLKELGVPVDWVDSHDSEMIVNAIGNSTGLFFVQDAATATDSQGRKIIAAQDFVSQYGVRSVFGVGGAYSTGQIAVIIIFCRTHITRYLAQQFLALSTFFISKTRRHIERGRVFL